MVKHIGVTPFTLPDDPKQQILVRQALRRASLSLPKGERELMLACADHPDTNIHELQGALGAKTAGFVIEKMQDATDNLMKYFPQLKPYLTGKATITSYESLEHLVPLVRIDHPENIRTLEDLGKQIVKNAGARLGTVAHELDLRTECLQGMATGEWIPGNDALGDIVRYCGLNGELTQQLCAFKAEHYRKLEAESPFKAKVLKVMENITASTKGKDLFYLLANVIPESKEPVQYDRGYRKSAYEMIKGVGESMKPANFTKFCEDLELTPLQKQLITQVNRGKPPRRYMGDILEEYRNEGQADFTKVMEGIEMQWQATRDEMADYLDVERSKYTEIINRGNVARLSAVEKSLRKKLGLEDRAIAHFRALAAGDHSLPPIAEMVDEARAKLRSLTGKAGTDEADLIRDTVRNVHARSGVMGIQLPKAGKRLIYENRPEIIPERNIASRDEIAKVYFPHDPVMARRFGNMMLGIADDETPYRLLTKVQDGTISFGRMLQICRLQRRENPQEFVKHFNERMAASLGTQYYRELENGDSKTPYFKTVTENLKKLANYIGLTQPEVVDAFVAEALSGQAQEEASPGFAGKVGKAGSRRVTSPQR